MQLAEYWPYALVVVSGAALIIVLVLLLGQPAAPNARRAARDREKRSASRVSGGATVRSSSTGGGPAIPHPTAGDASRPQSRERGAPNSSAEARSAPRRFSAPRENARHGAGFGAAAQAAAGSAGHAGAHEEQDFDIPSFLKREMEAASIVPAVDPALALEGRPLESGLGRLSYSPPQRMRALVGETVVVRLRREDERPSAPVTAALPRFHGEVAAPREPKPQIGFAVELSAPAGTLRIQTRSPLLQVPGGPQGVAEWKFRVTPLVAGPQPLQLVVAGCRPGQGSLEIESQETVTVEIRVRPNGRRLVLRAAKIFAGGAAIAFLTWLATLNADALRSAVSASTGAKAPRIVTPAATDK